MPLWLAAELSGALPRDSVAVAAVVGIPVAVGVGVGVVVVVVVDTEWEEDAVVDAADIHVGSWVHFDC